MKILIKRAYDIAEKDDGYRVLIDRLWPRGVSKIKAKIDFWAKDITPSTELRNWYHENPEKNFPIFIKKYKEELKKNKIEIEKIKKKLKNKPKTTLVTAVKDIKHSHVNTLLNALK